MSRRTGAQPLRLPPELRQAQILDSTLMLVLREGYPSVTVRAIAREAGITPPVIYEYYADREDVLRDLLDREQERALAVVSKVIPAIDTGRSQDLIASTLTDFLAVVTSEPDLWRFILLPPVGAPPDLRGRVDQARAEITSRVRDNLAALPLLRATWDIDLLARAFVAATEAAARMTVTDPGRYSPEQLSSVAEWFASRLDMGLPT